MLLRDRCRFIVGQAKFPYQCCRTAAQGIVVPFRKFPGPGAEMNLVIRSYLSASVLLECESKIWDAIVVLDTGLMPTDFVAQKARRHLFLHFDDALNAATGKRAPTNEQLQEALEFAAESENLLVACRAGQSRSAAIAFVIAYQRLGPLAAQAILNPKRHAPNKLIIELAAGHLADPTIESTFKEWQKVHHGVQLSDWLDEIEEEHDRLEREGAVNRIVGKGL